MGLVLSNSDYENDRITVWFITVNSLTAGDTFVFSASGANFSHGQAASLSFTAATTMVQAVASVTLAAAINALNHPSCKVMQGAGYLAIVWNDITAGGGIGTLNGTALTSARVVQTSVTSTPIPNLRLLREKATWQGQFNALQAEKDTAAADLSDALVANASLQASLAAVQVDLEDRQEQLNDALASSRSVSVSTSPAEKVASFSLGAMLGITLGNAKNSKESAKDEDPGVLIDLSS